MHRLTHCIIFVSDMQRSIRFYRDVLGLALKFETPEWTELGGEGVTLALHAAGKSNSPPPRDGKPIGGICQPGFVVDDLDAFHARVQQLGVPCVRPPTMAEFGAKLALYADPDGLVISIAGPH
jgi:lactoylglutathione lyase